jgi:hypothetical protein
LFRDATTAVSVDCASRDESREQADSAAHSAVPSAMSARNNFTRVMCSIALVSNWTSQTIEIAICCDYGARSPVRQSHVALSPTLVSR